MQDNIREVLAGLPKGVRLVAVSKTKPVEDIRAAYEAGQRVFGENRPREMEAKHTQLPQDIVWHFIGHLQEKNIKYIAPFVALIHSVDSLEALQRIDREAEKCGREIDCLLEFHIAEETTKVGLTYDEAAALLGSDGYAAMRHVRILGVMGMATYTDNREQVRKEFRHLKAIFDRLKAVYFQTEDSFRELSMGMSGDYDIAVEEGATMVRIGSKIFGERIYHA